MKANEMPERIYIFDYNDAMVTPLEGDTMYVREDAFIEKAIEFFENDLCCYIKAQDFVIEHGRLEKDFKNYMKQ